MSGRMPCSLERLKKTRYGGNHRRLRPYMNETGPGDYDVPEFTGTKSVLADKRSSPSFSFGVRTNKIQFISKEYLTVSFIFFPMNFIELSG